MYKRQAKIADKVSGVFVPTVIGIAIVTLIVWLLVGKPVGFALARAISVPVSYTHLDVYKRQGWYSSC